MMLLLMSTYSLFSQELFRLLILFARLAPIFFILPFLNDRVLNGLLIKNVVIFLLALGLYPAIPWSDFPEEINVIWLISGEVILGVIMGLLLGLPFWVASALGEFIDNQRGANIGDMVDPASGSESSELSSFMGLFFIAYFLEQGGMLELIHAFLEGYRQIPPGYFSGEIEIMTLASWLNHMVVISIVLAAPVLILMFISEIALGVYSLYCPQLNAFSLSLTIKSLLAFSALLIIFAPALPEELHGLFGFDMLKTVISER